LLLLQIPTASAGARFNVAQIRLTSSCCTVIYQEVYDPANHYLYVGVANNTFQGLAVIDTTTNTAVKYIRFGTQYTTPNYIAYDPSNNEIYVSSDEDNTVYVVSAKTNTMISSIVLYYEGRISIPFEIAYDGATKNMLVQIETNVGQFSVSNTTVVNSNTNTQEAVVNPYGFPVYDPLNHLLYGEVDYADNGIGICCYVAEINATTLQTLKLISVTKNLDSNLGQLVFDQSNKVVYGTNIFNHQVFAIKTTKGKLIKSLNISVCGPGNFCFLTGLAIDSQNRLLYVPLDCTVNHCSNDTVALINTKTNSLSGSIFVPGLAIYAAYTPNNKEVYETNYTNTVFSILPG
jgi:YVTN family beta-propeller protein